MQKEHGEFKEKLRKVSNELRQANIELEELRANRPSTAGDDGTEMQKLKFHQGALEKKLRKYATHCQSLEDEKERIADALSSSLDQKVPNGDIIVSVVSLCDQYTSLQKQCDTLKIQLQGQQSAFSRVKELEGIVSSLRSETEDLRKKLAKGQSLSNGENQKVSFLESENYKLLVEMKKLKTQFQAQRAELNRLQLSSLGESPTSTHFRRPLTSSADENTPLSPVDKVPSQKTDRKESSSSALKENLTLQASSSSLSSASSTKKRKSLFQRPGSSRKLRNSSKSAAPGLGEASRADSGNEPECKQS